MTDDARNKFFDKVNAASADGASESESLQIARLENTIVKEALKAGGASAMLKLLAKECADDQQLPEQVFNLAWFDDRYGSFPAKLLAGIGNYSSTTTLLDFLEKPQKSTLFAAYASALVRYNVDDTHQAICVVFRMGGKLYCIRNCANQQIFENIPAANNTVAAVIHTSEGDLCLQRYSQFLQSVGQTWCPTCLT